MNTMMRFFLALLAVVAVACSIGCGGVGQPWRGETKFMGAYDGTWRMSSGAEQGAMTLTVGSDALLVGGFTNTTLGTSGTINGSVDRSGNFSGEFRYADGPVVPISGKMTLRLDGQNVIGLTGDGTMRPPGMGNVPFTFLLDVR